MTMSTDCSDHSHLYRLLDTEVTAVCALSVVPFLALPYSGVGGWEYFSFPDPIRWLPTVGGTGVGRGWWEGLYLGLHQGHQEWMAQYGSSESPTCQACSHTPPCPFCSTPHSCAAGMELCSSREHTWSSVSYSDPRPEELQHRMFQAQSHHFSVKQDK